MAGVSMGRAEITESSIARILVRRAEALMRSSESGLERVFLGFLSFDECECECERGCE